MLKSLSATDLEALLQEIAARYRLLTPQTMSDGTRLLTDFEANAVAWVGPPLHRKPTEFFFPQTEPQVFLRADGSAELPEALPQALALAGLDAADLEAIAFLDRFFLQEPADDLYLRRRQGALLIGVSGHVGPQEQLLPLLNGGCDLELIFADSGCLGRPHSAVGVELLNDYPTAADSVLEDLQAAAAGHVPRALTLLQMASQLLRQERVPESFWEEISARCICCGGCNFACPTCNCFGVQDWVFQTGVQRSRVWDSCQLDAFMREASGHNPLGTEALRTRRRIHHKLVTDPIRWGELGCVACGRCDRACPTGIGILALAEEMVSRYQEG